MHGSTWSQLDCNLQHSDSQGQKRGHTVRLSWICVVDLLYFHGVGYFKVVVDLYEIESKGGKKSPSNRKVG